MTSGSHLNAQGLARLLDEQKRAITQTDQQIAQLDSFRQDYTDLADKLAAFPNKVCKPAILPFGKRAFVPGKLIHTNEIYAFLGTSYFALVSSQQAIQMVQRRITKLNTQINDFESQKRLLEGRLQFTQDLNENKESLFEIKEEFDPEKEASWKLEHAEKVKRAGELRLAQVPHSSDDAVLRRLEELEREEEQQSHNQLLIDKSNDCDRRIVHRKSSLKSVVRDDTGSSRCKVHFEDEPKPRSTTKDHSDEDSDDITSDDFTSDDSEGPSKSVSGKGFVIKFSHSCEPPISSVDSSPSLVDGSGPSTPGDINRWMESRTTAPTHPSGDDRLTISGDRPFSDRVMERDPTTSSVVEVSNPSLQTSSRPVSKFKSMRSGK